MQFTHSFGLISPVGWIACTGHSWAQVWQGRPQSG